LARSRMAFTIFPFTPLEARSTRPSGERSNCTGVASRIVAMILSPSTPALAILMTCALVRAGAAFADALAGALPAAPAAGDAPGLAGGLLAPTVADLDPVPLVAVLAAVGVLDAAAGEEAGALAGCSAASDLAVNVAPP